MKDAAQKLEEEIKTRITKKMLRALEKEADGIGGRAGVSIVVRKALEDYLKSRGHLLEPISGESAGDGKL